MKKFIMVTIVLCIAVLQAAFAADPEFVYLGSSPEGDDYRHDYKLSNIGGAEPIYDLEWDIQYNYGWININGPDDWAVVPIVGPLARWATDGAPCNVDEEKYGFSILAGTPSVTSATVTFTDQSHSTVATGTTSLPVGEATKFEYLGSSPEGNDYRHDYKLSNIGGAEPIYDLETDTTWTHGWANIYCPDDWAFQEIIGPLARWSTGAAPCNVDEELYGFSILAGTPQVAWGTVTFTDNSHAVVGQGMTVWPVDTSIPTTSEWGLIVMSLMVLTAGIVVIRRRRLAA